MVHLVDVHPKPDALKQMIRVLDHIRIGARSNHGARRFIGDSENEVPTALVRDRHTELYELSRVVLRLGLLELQTLVLRNSRPPLVDLCRSDAQVTTSASQRRPGLRWTRDDRGRLSIERPSLELIFIGSQLEFKGTCS